MSESESDLEVVIDENHLFFQTPSVLLLVFEFLPFYSLLQARCSCQAFAEATDGLSPDICAGIIQQEMKKRNIFFVQSWGEDGLVDFDDVKEHLFESKKRETDLAKHKDAKTTNEKKEETFENLSSSFDIMLRCFRVMFYLPHEAVVAFSGKYGRHLLPIDCVKGKRKKSFFNYECPSVKMYPPCGRGQKDCSTCQFVIPPIDKTGANGYSTNSNPIDDHLQIRGKNGNLDLTRFYNTCVPNLPSDLLCPLCKSKKRTLSLSMTSYASSGLNLLDINGLLSYTPCDKPQYTSSDEESKNNSSSNRFPFNRSSTSLSNPPPLYEDPSCNTGPHSNKDVKHAFAIYCMSCSQFAIISPSSPCHYNVQHKYPKSKFIVQSCHTTPPQGPEEDIFMGRTIVRTKCASSGCLCSVSCQFCTRQDIYYQREAFTAGKKKRRLFCERCNRRFCVSCTMKQQLVPSIKEDGRYSNYCGCNNKKLGKKFKKSKVNKKKKAQKKRQTVHLRERETHKRKCCIHGNGNSIDETKMFEQSDNERKDADHFFDGWEDDTSDVDVHVNQSDQDNVHEYDYLSNTVDQCDY